MSFRSLFAHVFAPFRSLSAHARFRLALHRHYRALVCDAIGADWDEQYRWVSEMGPDNPKNYQIWNFRKQCVKRTNQPQVRICNLSPLATSSVCICGGTGPFPLLLCAILTTNIGNGTA